MNKRLKFQCWNCLKIYFKSFDILNQQIIIKCPHCLKDAVVDLKPYRKQPKIVLRGEVKNNESDDGYLLPTILPTHKKEF